MCTNARTAKTNRPIPSSLGHIPVHFAHRLKCPHLTKKLKEKNIATDGKC